MQPDVSYAYYYEERNYNMGFPFVLQGGLHGPVTSGDRPGELSKDLNPELDTEPSPLNGSSQAIPRGAKIQKRAHVDRSTPFWAASQVSLPMGKKWRALDSMSFDPAGPTFIYHYDSAKEADTYVYMIHEGGIWEDHDVCSLCRSTVFAY
jgi:hypothetical protein